LANNRKLWDTYTGDTLETFSHDHIVRTVDISSSRDLVASGGHEKRVRLFDIQRASKSRDVGRHEGVIKYLVWDRSDPSDNVIITSGDDKRIVWWDLRSPSPAAEYTTDNMISSMEQSLDSQIIMVTAGQTALFLESKTFAVPSLITPC
jgi:serine-threonine kinase receptor-associated protein